MSFNRRFIKSRTCDGFKYRATTAFPIDQKHDFMLSHCVVSLELINHHIAPQGTPPHPPGLTGFPRTSDQVIVNVAGMLSTAAWPLEFSTAKVDSLRT